MSIVHGSALPVRSLRLKLSLLTLALTTLLLPATGRAQGTCSNTGSGSSTMTTCTGGPAINFTATDSTAQSSSITVPSGNVPTGGLVATVVVTLLGVKSAGTCNAQGTFCYFSLQSAEFLLKAPNQTEFVLLSSTGDGADGCDGNPSQTSACNGLQGTLLPNANPDTITITDGATNPAPYDVAWFTSSMPYTVKPSSYYYSNSSSWPPLPGGEQQGDFPQTDGCSNPSALPPCTAKTMNAAFQQGAANGNWTLYLIDNDTGYGAPDPVSINSWGLTLTYSITATAATTTGLISNAQPATYANSASSASVGFTAKVSTVSSGSPTGTVAFSANGTTVSGCSAVTLASSGSGTNASTATCTASLPQGNNNISAVYSPGSGFGQSSTSMTELVEVIAANNPSGSNTWCNNSLIADPIGGGAPIAYPSVIKINDSAYNSKSVATVSVNLQGVAGPVDGIGGQFLLVGPGGGAYNLDFLDSGFGDPGAISSIPNLTFEDLATPNYVSNSTTLGTQPTIDNPYSATDDNGDANPDTFPISLSPGIDTTIPQVPGTINFPPPYGTGNTHYTHNSILTFGKAFNGASANGPWSLYTVTGESLNVSSGWCITLSLNTGNTTTTTLTPSSNPATFGAPTTFTATVKSGSSAVTSGTVTFLDNDAVPAGTVSGNNVVTLNTTNGGVVTFITSSLTEGDHVITATYSGTATDNASFSSPLNQRINHATAVTKLSSTAWQYCNPGAVQIQQGSQPGPFTPNPSNIFVTNLPGSFNSVGVQLTNFSVLTADDLDELETLVEGPTPNGDTTGPALDFFSNTTIGNETGTAEATLGNYIFNDGASAHVTSSLQNIAPGTYLPTAYESYLSAPDTFTSSASGFYPAPAAGSFSYAPTNPLGTSQTFAEVFPSGSNVDGTWSLFFNSGFANATFGAANGWCVNMTVTPPVLAQPVLSHVGNFSQGQSNAQYVVNITNDGPGSTGDPTGGTYPMTVTDSLTPLGVTYSNFSGTGWNCSATSGTVTCTNDSAIADGSSYAPLTIEVNIPSSLTGQISNQITAGGAGTANRTSNTDSATIEVAPTFTSGSAATFTVGLPGTFSVTASGTPAPTFSVTAGNLPSGVTLSTAGVLSGTPLAGTGGSYPITITASNSTTNANQSFTLTVNQTPDITSAAGTTFTVGTSGSFSVTGTGYPAPTFSVTAGSLPTGVTLTSAGSLSGTPAAGTGGTYPITITATNSTAGATQSFTLNVDQASSITSAAGTTFIVGTSGSFSVTASGNPAPTYSVTAGTLPSGVTLSTAGALSGTPAAGTGGTYSITITAGNGIGSNATQSFTLTVDQAPAITSAANTTFAVGTAGSFNFTASGYPTAMTFSVTTGSLPSGVTLSSAGLLSGTPAALTGNSYALTITASNGVGTAATQSFTLAVNQAPTFALGATGSDTMNVSTPNAVLIFTSGYPTAAITESGALPSGVTFVDNGNGHGQLGGNPGATTGGLYNLVFTANNGILPNATLNYALTIKQPIAFTSSAGATFTTGAAGSSTVTTTGYPVPSFSETGALPNGVTFTDNGNGTASFTGTPQAGTGGSYPITIQATNGSSSPSQSFTLVVDQAPSITSANNTAFVAGSAGTFTASTTGYPTSALSESGALPSGITFTDNGNGTGTLAGTTATAGSFLITITANNGVSPSAVQSFTLTVNLPTYQITTAANPLVGGFVTPQSGTPFVQGSIVPLQATPATGYTFVGWTSAADPVASATSASTTITVNGPESVTAQFAPILVVNTNQDDAGTATNCQVQTTPATTSNADTCSLRDALLNAAAAGAGNITFDSTVFLSTNTAAANTIALSNGTTLTIPTNTSIIGPTSGSGSTLADLVTVAGGGASSDFPVFTVNSSAVNASISGLTISNANSSANGGGIVNGYGSGLTVINSTISGNTAASGTGGIFNDYNATLTVIGSTISGNSGSYGGIVNESGGTVTINSSTVAGNTGAGISSIGTSVTITASTISGNSGGYSGGGISNSSGALTLANSIVSGNIATTSPDIMGTFTNNGGNQIGVSASLAPLGNYGGPTQTMIPLPGNPALCDGTLANATAAGVTADQRGLQFDPACPSGFVDSGAAQTNYALAFTTQPPSNALIGVPLSPAPIVTVTESGSPLALAAGTVTVTDSDGALSPTGTNSVALSSGSATFSNLVLSATETSDTLTATLSLNPDLSPALDIVSPPSTGVNSAGIPAPPFGHLDSAVDSVSASTNVGQSDSVVITGWAADQTDGAPLSNVNVYIDGNLAGTPTLGIARKDVAAADGAAYLNSGYTLTYSVAALSPGSHAVTVIAIDSGARSTTFGPLTFTVTAAAGAAPPAPPFGKLDTAADSATGSKTVAQSDPLVVKGWVADQIDGAPLKNVNVYIDGILAGTPTLGIARPDVAAADGVAYLNSGYQLTYSAAALSAGSHAVTVIATDSGGRSTTFGPLAIIVVAVEDAPPTPPFGRLDSAVDSVTASTTVAQSGSVVVTGWAADQIDGAPLSNVKVYIDGNLAGTPTLGIARKDVAAADGPAYLDSGYTLTYSAAALATGSHAVTVIAIDLGGRSTTFGPLAFTVAAAAGAAPPPPPFGGLDSALDSVTGASTVAQSDSVVVKGWAADQLDGAPLSNVKVYIDGILAGTPTLGIARSDVATTYGSAYLDSGYKLTYSAATLALGSHSVTVIAIDSQGRSTTFGPRAFTVAAPPPFGHLDSAADSVTGTSTVSLSDSVVIKGWVADKVDGAPLSNVKVYIDGNLIGTPTLGIARTDVAAADGAAYLDSGYTLSYSAAALSLGSHAVTVIAIDSGARSTTFGPLTFTVQ